jgi:thiol-disulfide isomerase/thioredoxin
MKIKTIHVILVLLLVWVSFSGFAQKDYFTISLELEDFPDNCKCYGYYNETNRLENLTDTRLKGSLTNITLVYVIIFDTIQRRNREVIRLFIANNDVVIKGTLDDYEVKGPPTQDVLEQWRAVAGDAAKRRGKAMSQLFYMNQQPDVDSAVYKRVSEEAAHAQKLANEHTKNFVRSHPNSATALLLLTNIKNDFPRDTIRELFYLIPDKYKTMNFSQSFKSNLNALELYTQISPLEVGDEWVDFTANTIYGTTVSFYNLESVAGKYILLDFSSPGCIPCEISVSELKKIYRRYHDKVEIVTYNQGISTQILAEKAKNSEITWTYLGAGPKDQHYDHNAMYSYGAYGFPTFILISPQRTIAYKWDIGYNKGELLKVFGNGFFK